MQTRTTSISADSIFQDLQSIKTQAPLIHNITNYVVMNSTANALLAIGASPIMAHAKQELPDLLNAASALVINIGTLDLDWIDAMQEAVKIASHLNLPIVIDPVGAGTSSLRTNIARQLIRSAKHSVIRGNASEILALAGMTQQSKGVDSLHNSADAISAAQMLSNDFGHTIVVSGATDYCINQNQVVALNNGSPLMTKVTGMGCISTVIIAAFLSVNKDYLQASAHAMVLMGIVGELTAKQVSGPGSFAVQFLDMLYELDKIHIENTLKVADDVAR